jgi:hypothetical protein
MRALFAVCASFAVHALLYHALPKYKPFSSVCVPTVCASQPYEPPKYKFHKVVVHSTTWASRPLTVERWLTTRCLSGDLYSTSILMATIMYLEGYVDGCWMNVLTILCMASV